MSAWKPIETAPWETEVIVWGPSLSKVTAAYHSKKTGLWPKEEDYAEDGEPCNVGYPTKWMPLPDPPKEG